MKLTVAGIKIKITQAIEDHLHKKIEKSLKSLPESADVHVALTVEKHRHFAEVTVKEKGIPCMGNPKPMICTPPWMKPWRRQKNSSKNIKTDPKLLK